MWWHAARCKNNHHTKRCSVSVFSELCPAQLQLPQHPVFSTSLVERHNPTMTETNHKRQDNSKKITALLQQEEKIPLGLTSIFWIEGSRTWMPAMLMYKVIWKKERGKIPPRKRSVMSSCSILRKYNSSVESTWPWLSRSFKHTLKPIPISDALKYMHYWIMIDGWIRAWGSQ